MGDNSLEHGLNKRLVLIVEDNQLNRDILTSLLEDEYDVITACNGEEGYNMLALHYKELSVVMLDVYMPVCNGFEFLERVKKDPLLSQIPVIVTTGSEKVEDEVRSLDLGASDFVNKPYNAKIVLGRMRSVIKLKESVATLSVIEYDSLTGVLAMPAFYHYAEKAINESEDDFDLIVTDLLEFKIVNGSFGEKMGDEVLVFIARKINAFFPGAIVSRQTDKFFWLVPKKYGVDVDLLKKFVDVIIKEAPVPNLNLKLGFYPSVERCQDISILCDRVFMAISAIKEDFSKKISVYDEAISEKRVMEQKLEAEFDDALKNGEFVVWFQPKIDCKTGEIEAAEALVRWIKPDGKMLSPAMFIPLFERDGLIATLDAYVFEKVCEYQKQRINNGDRVFPISINLSRNSIYYMNTVEKYKKIVENYEIPINLVPIELTESAASSGRRIQELVDLLVTKGFSLQMDDFGSGYSSLSNLSALPFTELKLDKSLTDQIGNDRGNIVLKHIIEIAQELGLKVVAEGVETKDQLDFLIERGCDFIQGYYYSPPVSKEKLENLLLNWS